MTDRVANGRFKRGSYARVGAFRRLSRVESTQVRAERGLMRGRRVGRLDPAFTGRRGIREAQIVQEVTQELVDRTAGPRPDRGRAAHG